MNRDLKQLIIGVLIIFILGMLFFMNQEKDNKALNPIAANHIIIKACFEILLIF